MQQLQRLVTWMALRGLPPDLAIAQYRELQKQVPLLYALLSVNAVAVSYTHLDNSPAWIAIWIPAVLVSASLLRLLMWSRSHHREVTSSEAVYHLRKTVILGALTAVAYITWALGLGQYGGEQHQAHVAIFIAITVIGCIFCLMPLPQAALLVTGLVSVPYLSYYLSRGDEVYAAVGINILLVTLVMIRVLLNGHQGFVALVRSQTEMDRLNKEVTVLAHTDPLTGLPNRRLFFTQLSERIAKASSREKPVSVGIIDLDRFKAVNDTYGHAVGDHLLEFVGARLAGLFTDGAVVSRLGGDEFAFHVEAGAEDAVTLGNTACKMLSQPFLIGDLTIVIGASCGVASLGETAVEARSLYDGADYALYNAKEHRRGFATLYSAEHERHIRSEYAVGANLQTADLDAEMSLHLQPIIRADGVIGAVEALARWDSPVLGSVRPDVFIPLAERAGIIHRLTLVLFGKALDALRQLPRTIAISFNLSAHDLTSPETVLALLAMMREAKVNPRRIIFELTETAVMRDFDCADASIRLLRAFGVSIALDDFGTGQSSLSHLHRLPIDKVKIDRSFVADSEDASGADLLSAVVALCTRMRMECVAEGVENAAQLDTLRHIGCHGFQGYHFAKPMPLDAALDWIDCWRRTAWIDDFHAAECAM
jgi:diguanylate cyclase (GGDEF)-like protein